MGTGSFPGVKRPERGADHPHPSKCRGHERVELYLYSPSGPLCPVIGRTFTFTWIYYKNFGFSQELEDRLNPKQNGDAQSQAASSYTQIQGEAFFKVASWSACMLSKVSCPVWHKEVVEKICHREIAFSYYCTVRYKYSLFLNNFQVIYWSCISYRSCIVHNVMEVRLLIFKQKVLNVIEVYTCMWCYLKYSNIF